MKLTLSLIMLVAMALFAAQVQLQWHHNNASSENTFYLIRTTNLSIPKSNWTVVAVIPGLETNYFLETEPGGYYYTLFASNRWGKSGYAIKMEGN